MLKFDDPDFTPFPIVKYTGPEYFCDRADELKRLVSAVKNDRPVTIFSVRRMGKTGLVKHLHHHLRKSRKYICIYVDIFATTSDVEFANKLVTASIAALKTNKKSFVTDMVEVFSKYKPRITFDHTTGQPAIELGIHTAAEAKMSLNTLFSLLAEQKKTVQIAIDEFQQIALYDKKSTVAATVREYMQSIQNLHFIFSGSQRHLLLDIFNNPKQPLFRMVDQLYLHEIGFSDYHKFIVEQFKKAGREIDDTVVHDLLRWTRQHTFYVQVICNKLYGLGKKKIESRDLTMVQQDTLKELEMNFINIKRLMSVNQYKTLRGIAKEGTVTTVRSKDFTKNYNLAASTAQQSLEFLLDKEMVYEKIGEEKTDYQVYDLFLSKWLELS